MAADTNTPTHIAIIMDGNRRWARARGVPEAQGHAAGVEAIRPIVRRASDLGVEACQISTDTQGPSIQNLALVHCDPGVSTSS